MKDFACFNEWILHWPAVLKTMGKNPSKSQTGHTEVEVNDEERRENQGK